MSDSDCQACSAPLPGVAVTSTSTAAKATDVTLYNPTTQPTTAALEPAAAEQPTFPQAVSQTVPETPQSQLKPCELVAQPDQKVGNPLVIKACKIAVQMLPAWLTGGRDAKDSEQFTLLARVGAELVKIAGSGILVFKNGKAQLVSAMRATAVRLLLKNTYPYEAALDSEGEVYAVTGIDGKASVKQWNPTTKEWEIIEAAKLTKAVIGALPTSSQLELVGYSPLDCSCGTTADSERELKRLTGEGVIIQRKCGDSYYAEIVPFSQIPTT